jgi:hypothetical protein
VFRWIQLPIGAALLLGSSTLSAQALSSGPRAHDPWNPQHIDSLPAEIRGAIGPYSRVCGGPLRAQHSFATYFQRGAARLIGLHFEHLSCRNRPGF